jgi:hypothetical protein
VPERIRGMSSGGLKLVSGPAYWLLARRWQPRAKRIQTLLFIALNYSEIKDSQCNSKTEIGSGGTKKDGLRAALMAFSGIKKNYCEVRPGMLPLCKYIVVSQ